MGLNEAEKRALIDYIQAQGLAPDPSGGHDSLGSQDSASRVITGQSQRIMRAGPDQLRVFLNQVNGSYLRMVTDREWSAPEARGLWKLFQWARQYNTTMQFAGESHSHLMGDWWEAYKHPDEKRQASQLICALEFTTLVDHHIGTDNPSSRARCAHAMSVELAKLIGFRVGDGDIFKMFPDLTCYSGQSRLSPRISHDVWDYELSFCLAGPRFTSFREPYFATGVSVIQRSIDS